MSISSEISRILADRNTIRDKLVELGMATSTANLHQLAAVIDGLVNQGAISVTVQEGETYTIPQGYHNGSGTVSGVSSGRDYTLQSKTATPTKNQQKLTPDSGYYGLSEVNIGPIPDNYQDVSGVTAGAGDVLSGKIYVTAEGTVTAGIMVNNGAVNKTLDMTVVRYTIPKGYHSGTGTVKITLETKTVTPTKDSQVVTPSSGKVLGKVTVTPIPDNYIDTSDASAAAGNILAGKTAYAGGRKLNGTMADNGAIGGPMDGLTVTSVVIPAGYTSGGTVSLTGDIESALAAI